MSRRDRDDFFWQGGADLNKLSEELSSLRPKIASNKSWEPLVDLTEETTRLVLKAEIAGVTTEEIELTYLDARHAILLRGIRSEDVESDEDRVGVFQLEILYGHFERIIALPENVAIDVANIRALFRNGILIVLIPKKIATLHQVVIETL
jgi:HSP20 family molecular chaperone IbpA